MLCCINNTLNHLTPATVSIKLLDRLEKLVQDWTVLHANGSQLLGSLSNLHQQRKLTWSFYKPATPASDDYSNSTNASMDLDVQLASHPAIVPPFLQLFPCVIDRLIMKQTCSLEKIMSSLDELVDDYRKTVNTMQALTKDAHAKSLSSLYGKVFLSTADLPTFLAADWIDTIVAGYQRELLFKEDLISKLDLRMDGNIDVTRRQWEVTQWLDLKLEVAVRDRVKLAKQTCR
ncbi:hypothetical protein MT418_007503 [Batrachochytrium dendrobatidis]